jgi:hypothetical protein
MAASRESKKKTASQTGAALRQLRPKAERTGPNRSANGYVKADAAAPEPQASRTPPPGADGKRRRTTDAVEDAVTRAVKLGYQVAEEQMHKSKAAAESLQKASAALGRGDPGEAFAQTLHTAKAVGDMATHLVENASSNTQLLAQAIGGEGGASDWTALIARLRELLAGKVPGTVTGGEGDASRLSWDVLLQQYLDTMRSVSQSLGGVGGSAKAGQAGRVLVVCDRLAASGSLALSRKPTTEALSCHGLVGKVDGKSQLLDAQISAMAETGGVWEVTVKVGRGAAPGVYRGVVLDGDTPAGLLELTLRKV